MHWIGLLVFAVFLAFLTVSESPAQDAAATAREDVLSYADLLYSKKKFGLAAQQYQIFIKEQPRSVNIQSAWFRLGECYLQVKQQPDAETTFNYLITTFKKGPFVGSAAYRLAVVRFNTKDYKNALTFFKLASTELTNEEAKLQAQFYLARCYQLTKQLQLALTQYESLVEKNGKPGENPFYERSLLAAARLLFDLGETDKSLERFEKLANEAKTKEIKEEAIVRGGLLAAEAGKPELSEKFLDLALRFSDTSPWKSLAQVGAIFNAFAREDYDKVIGIYNTGAYDAPVESRAKMLLIVGHSFRMKDDLDSALRLYSLVEGKFPDQPEGAEAGYRKLQILHQQQGATLAAEAARYIDRQRLSNPESKYIDLAYLMKAEWHFNKAENSASGPESKFTKENFKSSAEAYSKVRVKNVDEKFHEIRLYKQGWSEIESGAYAEGIKSLSRFLIAHPKSDLASSALAKRATTHQAMNNHTLALGDYQGIVDAYPSAPELEFAMQQVALIQGHLRQIPEMIASYQTLLKRFPKTSGASEAHYWIGVGHFDQEKYEESIPELEKARELGAVEYGDKATLRLVLAHYQLENIEKLTVETKAYIAAASAPEIEVKKKIKRTTIPPQILEYLGRKLAKAGNFTDAASFLTAMSTPTEPAKTQADVWKLLAECQVELKEHQKAIDAFDHYLVQTKRPSERASAYLNRGKAQLCLRDFAAARESARESLRSQKEGRTNAEARILMGDVSVVEGNLDEAAREYLVVSQIFTDREVTPKALTKAINAYISLGKPDQANKLKEQLLKAFPDYKAPEKMDDDC